VNNVESEGDRELLIDKSVYLAAGVHIGTKIRTKDMKRYVYKIRQDGLAVIDVEKTDERIRVAAKFIARHEPERVLAVSSRIYGFKPVKRFGEFTRIPTVVGRILPGVMTNPSSPSYKEPETVILSDPKVDRQAHIEAIELGIPIISLVDLDNTLYFVDFAIPCNNKGKKALALIYWLLARQVLRERGEIPEDGDLGVGYEDFITEITGV